MPGSASVEPEPTLSFDRVVQQAVMHATVSSAEQVDTGSLLLADISGYTSFLQEVAAAHPEMTRPGAQVPPAYPVMSSLLDVTVTGGTLMDPPPPAP